MGMCMRCETVCGGILFVMLTAVVCLVSMETWLPIWAQRGWEIVSRVNAHNGLYLKLEVFTSEVESEGMCPHTVNYHTWWLLGEL